MFLEFERVDSFTCGTVGRPGQRTFLVDVRGDAGRVEPRQTRQVVHERLRRGDSPGAGDRQEPRHDGVAKQVEAVAGVG